jgi:predicted TIM-barrel fold metal-dependent hydrolase
MIIDFHTHIFPPRIKKNRSRYVDCDPCFSVLYSNPNAALVTVDELITSMDDTGVDMSIILNIGWETHELCIETNDYILESISRYPQRLVGFCTVQLESPQAALEEIERCVKGGAKGIGELRPDIQLFDMGSDHLIKPIAELINKHNVIMLIHASEPVGHSYPGKGALTPAVLYPFIAGNPELKIVCSHWGGGLPFYALMPEVKKAISNVYFDTAASPLLYSQRMYEQAAQLVGANKILFGSDYPLLAQQRGIKEIESSNLPEDSKSLILAGNAVRLLGINRN